MKMGGLIVRKKIVIEGSVLSERHGGAARCRSYCVYFQDRPSILKTILCAGCPDQERCSDNSPPPVRMVWLNVG